MSWNDESSILIKCWWYIVLSSGSVESVTGEDVCCEYWYFKISAMKNEKEVFALNMSNLGVVFQIISFQFLK